MIKTKLRPALMLAAALAAAAPPVYAGADRFMDSKAAKEAKEKDEDMSFLKDYERLTKGKEADWVWFAEGTDPKKYKTVSFKEFSATGKGTMTRQNAEYGEEYLDKWITKSKKLGWEVVKGKGDLKLEGNLFSTWEPSGGAKFWGGVYVNPGAGVELRGTDASGKVVFEVRHKAKGSTVHDAVENGIQKIIETLEKWK